LNFKTKCITVNLLIKKILKKTTQQTEIDVFGDYVVEDTASFFKCSINVWRLTSSVKIGAPSD